MEKKANTNKSKKKKLLTIVIVFAVVLAVTATTWCFSPSIPDTPRIPDLPSTYPSKCFDEMSHFSSGCALLKHYDKNNDGKIDDSELSEAADDYNIATLFANEYEFVAVANAKGSINDLCPGCHP